MLILQTTVQTYCVEERSHDLDDAHRWAATFRKRAAMRHDPYDASVADKFDQLAHDRADELLSAMLAAGL